MAARRFGSVLLVLVLGFALMPGAGASGEGGGVYLSMGDSVAAGTGPFGETSDKAYTDVLFRHIDRHHGFETHLDISCPGETSGGLISGVDSFCFTPGMSQLDAALSFIADNPGAVELITIDIGANDVLGCTSDPDLEGCANAALVELGGNLTHILTQLRGAVGFEVPILAMNYYNPLMAYQLSPDPAQQGLAAASPGLVAALNDNVLAPVYAGFGVEMADVARSFRTFDTWGWRYPRNLRVMCRFTYMCEWDHWYLVLSDWNPDPGAQPDIHPNPWGHRRIAKQFLRLFHGY